MEWINIISNKDAKISKININNLYVTLEIESWNEELRKINFRNYYIIKEKNSIDEEIGDIKHFVFYNSWNNRVILEILAEIAEYI